MEQESNAVVHGRCACGKRYRIRHARPGIVVSCPNCRRTIPVTLADLQRADSSTSLIPFETEQIELLEAIPVNHGMLRTAPHGSRPGLTGARILSHEEAVLANVLVRNPMLARTYENMNPAPVSAWSTWAEVESEPRSFTRDLLAGLYFTGSLRNAVKILAIACACSVLAYVLILPTVLFFIAPILFLILMYMLQFFWNVMKMTAYNEDLIPWSQEGWSVWHDGLKPTLWIVGISAICSAPCWLLSEYGPPAIANNALALWIVLGACWFFWPIAVMSAAIGDAILFVRPDRLVRCVIDLGPAYLAAWAAVMVAVGGWYLSLIFWRDWLWIPVAGFVVNLYLGYQVFRTLGLLFRHFRNRLPWRY